MIEKLKDIVKNNLLLFCLIITIVIAVMDQCVFLFLLFLVIYIHIPGKCLLNTLCSNKHMGIAEEALLGFFVGLGILIIEYCALSALGQKLIFVLLSPIIVIALIAYRFRNNSPINYLKSNIRWNSQLFAVAAIIAMLTGLTQRYAFVDFREYEAIYLYQDFSWHIGNVAALSKGVPFADYRFEGILFNYHYFNDLIFGMCKYCFNVRADELFFKCTPILSIYLLSLSMYLFFNKKESNPVIGTVLQVLCGAAIPYLILNADDWYSLFNYHLFSNINGVAVSLASVIAVYLYFCRLYNGSKAEVSEMIVLGLLIFVMTGLKGPFAVVMIAALVFTSILTACFDHCIKRALTIVMTAASSFLITYITVIKGVENLFKESNNNRATSLSLTGTFSSSRLWPYFSGLAEKNDLWSILLYCICVLVIGSVMAAGIFYIVFLCETIVLAKKIATRRWIPSSDLVLSISAGWVGLLGFWLVSHIGFSQTYFLFVSILFVVGEMSRLLSTTSLKYLKMTLLALAFINIFISGWMYFSSLDKSIRDDSVHFDYRRERVAEDTPQFLTKEEIEGLQWIRDNTDKNCVIATDRLDLWSLQYPSADSDCRSFYYSAFAERQMYIEGFSYSDVSQEETEAKLEMNQDIYSDNDLVARKAIEETGVDYIIVSKRFREVPGYLTDPVFDNIDISIYDYQN